MSSSGIEPQCLLSSNPMLFPDAYNTSPALPGLGALGNAETMRGTKRKAHEKVKLFRQVIAGHKEVYGTYDVETGSACVVNKHVSYEVIFWHLQGRQPYVICLLDGDRTRTAVAVFDDEDLRPPTEFVAACRGYGILAYVERRKSKGYRVWVFFPEPGVPSAKARLVMQHLLGEIGHPSTDVFPKQDSFNTSDGHDSFILAPLFGRAVPEGRTVFLDLGNGAKPYPNQWDFLDNIKSVSEALLDDIIRVNKLNRRGGDQASIAVPSTNHKVCTIGLPICAQRILAEGVAQNQRFACFRLAVSLQQAGLPHDMAIRVLTAWATKNKPKDGKPIITHEEITEQIDSAYAKGYRGHRCNQPAVSPFCSKDCVLHRERHGNSPSGG